MKVEAKKVKKGLCGICPSGCGIEIVMKGERLHQNFGTGYSALSYLKRLPVDVLQIDQSFVRELTTHPVNATITEAIVRLARGLDLATIAEGVETPEQLLLLGSYGCHRMQGYLFGRPSPPDQFAEWLSHPPFSWNHRESGRRL